MRSVLVVAVICLLALFGCEKQEEPATASSVKQLEWPPRTGRNDQSAASIMQDAQLTLEIPETAKVKYSGAQEPVGGNFAPVVGGFDVSGGTLFSKVGPIQKEATFHAWAYVYSDGEKKEVVGWGPCLTSGEIIVSNIFTQDVPSNFMVENSFDAEDFGPRYTLITLDPSKGHRLCIWLKLPDTGMRVSGGITKLGSGEVGGKVADSIDSTDDLLFNTAGYIGTTATFGDKKFLRQKDGWYLGTKKVSR